ncbi:hypothetical protein D3C72_2401390 [compost metagenome]
MLAGLRESLLAHGLSPERAAQGAFALLGKAAGQEATVQGFADLYLICLAVTLVGLVPTVFIKLRRA